VETRLQFRPAILAVLRSVSDTEIVLHDARIVADGAVLGME